MATYYIDYQAYDQMNPQTGAKDLRCGRIVNRRLLEGKNLAEALQKKAVAQGMTLEEFNGLMNAINAKKRELVLEGYRVKDDYITMETVMNGQLGVNDSIGPNTKVTIHIDARDDMKIGDDVKLSYHNVDKIASVTVDSICTVGGTVLGEWAKNKAARVSGKELVYDAAIGDKVTATFVAEGETRTVDLTVSASSANSMELAWHEDLFYVTAGDTIDVTFVLHGGVAEATPKTITKKVTMVAA